MPGYTFQDRRGQSARVSQPSAGYLFSNSYQNAADRRPIFYSLADTRVAVNEWDRRDLVRVSRALYAQMSDIGGAINQKAQWSTVDGWSPRFMGANTSWGDSAEEWLSDVWYQNCNVLGLNYDFLGTLFSISVHLDIDGEILLAATSDRSGWPLISLIPSHRIGTRNFETTVKSGRYKGATIQDGVITNASGKVIAYRILGASSDGSEDYDLSANSAVLLFENTFADMYRGITPMARAWEDITDVKDALHYMKIGLKLDASLPVIHENRTGQPDSGAPLAGFGLTEITKPTSDKPVPPQPAVFEQMANGILYARATDGTQLKITSSERPHSNGREFLETLQRKALFSIGWPVELLDASKIGGASVRLCQDLVRKNIRSRQRTLMRAARFMTSYAVAVAMKSTILPDNSKDKWSAFDWSMPAKLTVDAGYEAQMDNAALLLGTESLANIVGKRGGDWFKLRQDIERESRDLLDRATALAKDYPDLGLQGALQLLSQRGPNPTPIPPTVDAAQQ
jgi:hypothetical protein